MVAVAITLPAADADRQEAVQLYAAAAIDQTLRELALPITATNPVVVVGDALEIAINGYRCEVPSTKYLVRHTSTVEDRIAHTIHLNAEFLITTEVADTIWKAVVEPSDATPNDPPPWFAGLVRKLVRHRARPDRLAPLLAAGSPSEPKSLFEAVLDESSRITVVIDEKTAAGDGHESWRSLLLDLATGLTEELGVPLPIPRLEVEPSLPDYHHAVQVGDLRTLALPGLRHDELLVNDTSERLQPLTFDGPQPRPVTNPSTGLPAAVVSASSKEALEAAGWTTWSMRGYVVMACAEIVRRHAAALVHQRLLRYQLARLESESRTLRPTVEALGGVLSLTPVVRRLVAEQVPIHRLPDLLTGLLASAPPAPEDPRLVRVTTRRHRVEVVPAPELDDIVEASLAETCRGLLSTALSRQLSRSTTTLVVYLLDPAIEERLRDPAELTPDERRAFLDMIAAEMAYLPATVVMLPVLLTRARVRARLRSVVQVEHPRLKVAAYEELNGNLNIQPVARLSLT
ncbi:FHIPEP family type III secretion protein [[Micrococcus luteus] ATCC 49442]|uniref:FHIPEP family type III secretion protein n=1 Tax=[Micrococcus luteus] ATCC 49442 TaxID=2698727 RepID=UPI0013DA7B91|nr:FHIPEP family type III secretion protein [[Micrococcus luteus] ATCC 49442]